MLRPARVLLLCRSMCREIQNYHGLVIVSLIRTSVSLKLYNSYLTMSVNKGKIIYYGRAPNEGELCQ